jgi:hypothetical protein
VFSFSPEATAEAAPTDLEGRAVVKHFLERYLSYTPDSVDRIIYAILNSLNEKYEWKNRTLRLFTLAA